MTDPSHTKRHLIDLNAKIKKTQDYIHTDGLHTLKTALSLV